MNINSWRRLFIALVLLAAGAMPATVRAVAFTITPSTISNTYSGVINFQVTALTSGDTVVVQKFLDVNTNGAVDSGDFLVQQFQLTDGVASVFTNGTTSVTNFNVPSDTDGSANTTITAQLYPGMDFLQEIVGKYLFVLSSPAGHFTPQTNAFTVTNFPFAQILTGNVVSNGTVIPNGVVIVFQPVNGGLNPLGGTVANNAGAYTIQTPPGTYHLVAFKTNCVANLSVSPYVTIGAPGTITTNVPLTNATQSISGRIVDTNNTSLGLAGVLLPVQTTNGQFLALAFTDTNGNFVAKVTSNVWKAGGDSQQLALKGYVGLDSKVKINTTAGNVSGVSIALPKATAIFYGTVQDNLGNPLTGVDVEGDDNTSNGGLFFYSNSCYTFTNGNYVLGVLSGDGWESYINSQDQSGIYTNYIFSEASSQQNGGVLFGGRQAVQQNFIGILATNSITGHVQFNGGPVVGAGVNANATISGLAYQAHTDTDANGNYILNVANGEWSVSVNCGGGGDGLINVLGAGNFQCPNNDDVVILNNGGTANFTVIPNNSGQVFGYLLDDYGNPIAGVNVYASDGSGHNYTNATTGSGYFSIVAINGNYTISVDCGQLTALNYYCVGGNSTTVSGGSQEVDFTTTPVASLVYPFTALHAFSAAGTGPNTLPTNSDGALPAEGLILTGGTLFGTAEYGGTNGAGTVFSVNTNLSPFSVVHTFSFPATNRSGIYTNSEGGVPEAGLILVSNILYSTAFYGGTNGNGTVFAVNTNGTGYRVIHTFATVGTNSMNMLTNSDGANPGGATVLFSNILYGTAVGGGTNGYGTVFAVNTNGTFIILHTFTALDANTQTTNSDGANPFGGLILNGGTLYGTAEAGGAAGVGTIFSINTNGTGFTVLYNFTGGNDGGNPEAGLVLAGNTLYGVAYNGGHWGAGTVFAANTNGTGYSVLHAFNGGDGGAAPYGGLILSNNTLYGTTTSGGGYNSGTVYAISTSGTNFTVIHTFTGGSDGANPYGSLVMSGNTLYGTATSGGVNGSGAVFAVSVAAQANILLPSHPTGHVFQMLVNGSSGQNYTVQMTTNVSIPNWTSPTNWVSVLVTNPTGSKFLYSDLNATNKERLYRVLTGP